MATQDVTIATAIQSRTVPSGTSGHSVTTTSRSAHLSAELDAAVSLMLASRTSGDLAEQLAAADGQRVTLLCAGSNFYSATNVYARPGYLFNDGTAILPKGRRSKGYRIDVDRLLGFVPGYSVSKAAELLDQYRFGAVSALNSTALASLPHHGSTCAVAVVTTYPILGERVPGCLWLLHSYMADDDICEGYLVVPDHCGFVSEHGSIFGKDLLSTDAAVLDTALPMPLRDVIDTSDVDYDTVLAALGIRGAARRIHVTA